MPDKTDIGRFAPSPSGPLHLGSLFTALASFLQARSKKGKWFVRIDDLDTPRVVSGAADNILKTLEEHSLLWDGAVLYQSQQKALYQEAIGSLQIQSLIYRCDCSRKQLLENNDGKSVIHSEYCLTSKKSAPNTPHALRIKTKSISIEFNDLLQGTVTQDIHKEVGDFILKRQDQIHAYHLATVIDDDFLGVTEVLRGIDLLHSTPRQIYLQQLLRLKAPSFTHIPILTNSEGIKLSKKCLAESVGNNPVKTLLTCLNLLAQEPPSELSKASKNELLEWAIENWDPIKLKSIKELDCSTRGGISPRDCYNLDS